MTVAKELKEQGNSQEATWTKKQGQIGKQGRKDKNYSK